MGEFTNKVVVVTGGAHGIGKCIADEFTKQGAKVYVIDKAEGDHYVGDISRKEVLEDLEVIKEKQEKGLLDGDFSYNNAEALLNMIKEYTEKLVEANNQSMPDTVELKNDKIVDLQTYLKIQKNVFRNNRSA